MLRRSCCGRKINRFSSVQFTATLVLATAGALAQPDRGAEPRLQLPAVGEPILSPERNVFPNLSEVGNEYSFAIFADPQVGHMESHGRMCLDARRGQILAVQEVNQRRPRPAFAVFLGDMANVPDEKSWYNWLDCIADLKPPAVLVHGNHDTRPPYELYRRVQKKVNGREEMFYSFDAGRWHYVVLPCNFDGDHTEHRRFEEAILKWLEADLQANRERPTAVFEHLPLLPVGLSQLEWYTFRLDLRVKLMDLLTRHGNVRYCFCGHVHNGIQTSVKTAWAYKGIRFVVAPTIIHARQFGEEYDSFKLGLIQGGYYMVVDVKGERMTLKGRAVDCGEEFVFPDTFPEFREEIEPRWFKRQAEFAPAATLVNGDFEGGMKGWTPTFRYAADRDPGFVCKVEPGIGQAGGQGLLVRTREKGQDWANDEYTEAYQMVAAPPGRAVLQASWFLPENPVSGGGYIRLVGLKGDEFQCMLMFQWGSDEEKADFLPRCLGYAMYGSMQGWRWLSEIGRQQRGLYVRVPEATGAWQDLRADVAGLYDKAVGSPGAFEKLGVTKYLVAAGTWCNKDRGSRSEARFDSIGLSGETEPGTITVGGRPLPVDSTLFESRFGQNLADNEARRLKVEQEQKAKQ